MKKQKETAFEYWDRLAREATAISEGMRKLNPERYNEAERVVRANMARIPQFATLRKLH